MIKPIHILVAEDNRADVLLIREALTTHGVPHELHVLQDGAQAIEFIGVMGTSPRTPCPDVMLLDLNLPKVEGSDVLQAFRNHSSCATTPVIVISSSDSPKEREKVAAMKVTHYFKKPSDFDEYMKLGQVILQAVQDAE